jgi:hypothetical protein
VAILARVLARKDGQLSPALARHILSLEFDDCDKARMHDLAVRNQHDQLSTSEKDELIAYAKAGSLLSLLKSRARRTLRAKAKDQSTT